MVEGMGDSLFGFLRLLCKGLEGQSKSLDRSLSKLRTHMMNSEDEIPENLILDIEKNVRILNLERQESSQEFLDIGKSWQRSLNKFDLNKEHKQQLKEIAHEFKDTKKNHYHLPATLKVLLDLQLAADNITAQASDYSGEAQTLALKKIADEMIQLLGQINLPPNPNNICGQLIGELQVGLKLTSLPVIIAQITKIIASELAAKGDDFSNYLHSLNKQLNEVQGYINTSQSIDKKGAAARSNTDEQVRDSVYKISQSVSESTQIGELKKNLSVQLEQIIGAMDSLKVEEQKRDDDLLVNNQALKERISVMEKEADKVQEYIEEERRKAREDVLTGLPNRAAYNDIMAHQLENWKRYQKPLTIVICDLDFFKRVNDNYGHLAGDKVLSLVAKLLFKGTRGSDFVTRYGGEEFVIIMPSTEAVKAERAMNKIRRLIGSSPFNYHGKPISITMSFGLSEAVAGDSIEDLFHRADTALYKAKEQGRNKVCVS